jgi:hypothetical protein
MIGNVLSRGTGVKELEFREIGWRKWIKVTGGGEKKYKRECNSLR